MCYVRDFVDNCIGGIIVIIIEGEPMNLANILRIVVLLVAVVGAFVAIPQAALILVVLGLVAGFVGVEEDNRQNYLILAIALTTVAGSLGGIPGVGGYISSILSDVSSAVNAGAVAVIVTINHERVPY